MIYDKKAFRKAAAIIAESNVITFRKAKHLLAQAIYWKQQSEAMQAEVQHHPEIQGLWVKLELKKLL